ncbi:MAG: glycoside hydrolase family 88 protein [Clostridia bacterium]|nr:glycoside hydrolase family 88 protein [Clostridia bacterium]
MKQILDLCDYLTKTWVPEEKRWGWGEGLFAYALTELDAYLKEDRYLPFVTRYIDKYVKQTPAIDCSDTAAPGLASYYLQKKTKNANYKELTDKVIDYIKNCTKILEDMPNHFGTSKDAKTYPQSVWVDSLMMFSVFTVRYGAEARDKELFDYGAKLPAQFAKYLMDNQEHLWYHAYWVKQCTHYPRRKLFWGRGNGWVMASFPMIYQYLGKEHPQSKEIIEIYRKTSLALLKYQRADGTFETVFNKVGKTYRELSATALICGGWLDAIAQGMLDEKTFLNPALKGYNACLDSIIYENEGVFFPEISRPTVPMKVIPYTWYKWMPLGRNWNYGVAALVFAALNYQKYLDSKQN